jgi:hypothetical protein
MKDKILNLIISILVICIGYGIGYEGYRLLSTNHNKNADTQKSINKLEDDVMERKDINSYRLLVSLYQPNRKQIYPNYLYYSIFMADIYPPANYDVYIALKNIYASGKFGKMDRQTANFALYFLRRAVVLHVKDSMKEMNSLKKGDFPFIDLLQIRNKVKSCRETDN